MIEILSNSKLGFADVGIGLVGELRGLGDGVAEEAVDAGFGVAVEVEAIHGVAVIVVEEEVVATGDEVVPEIVGKAEGERRGIGVREDDQDVGEVGDVVELALAIDDHLILEVFGSFVEYFTSLNTVFVIKVVNNIYFKVFVVPGDQESLVEEGGVLSGVAAEHEDIPLFEGVGDLLGGELTEVVIRTSERHLLRRGKSLSKLPNFFVISLRSSKIWTFTV